MAQYTATDIAVFTVNLCIDDGKPISNLQLQKILYFIQREYMKTNDGACLFGDDFQAWQYGPVIPEVYRKFSIWGGDKITSRINVDHKAPEAKDREIIVSVIEKYREKYPWDLVDETHAEGTPWKITMDSLGDGAVITKELIANACAH